MADRVVKGERFPRKLRIRKRGEYHHVFSNGQRLYSPEFHIVVCPNSEGVTRLGMAVSRKVGNAPVRNRVKRRLRECFRRNYDQMPVATDIVVIARPRAATIEFDRFREVFLRLVNEEPRPRRRRARPDQESS